MTYERGGIVFPYLISNLLYFVTGICRTTWSNSSYQEYLQISLRCSSCRYHSLRTCVSTHIHFYISRTTSNATVNETMKVVKLNKYEYIHSIQLHYVIIPKIQKDNDNDDNSSLLYAHSESS